jgi:CHAT domain-containing protein/tetratricopeptide (TPR) repeat protein
MIRLSVFIFISFALLFSFAQVNPVKQEYLASYQKADKLFHDAENYEARTGDAATEEKMNKQSMDLFKQIIPSVENDRNDSLAFHCYYKAAVLYHYFENLPQAKEYYLKALKSISKTNPVPDSFYFKPHLYAGSIYYSNENFDSALYHYKKADNILSKSARPLQESERLYNRLGVIYYETGNYSQANKYFEKAVDVLGNPNNLNRDLYVYYKNNIAASLMKMLQYDGANTIYKSILPFNIRTNEILNNIGFIQLELGTSDQALNYFRKIKDTTDRNVQVMNNMGRAYYNKDNTDSARYYFLLAEIDNKKRNGTKKNILRGLTSRYLGDLFFKEDRFAEAVENYHAAIGNFITEFNDRNIFVNPEQFTGVFSFINLFHTLTGKAAAFEGWYKKEKDTKYLIASLATYHSAFNLAGYVEKNYNSDEARVFLNKIKYTAHNKPIQVSLQLYELTADKKYLEEAYFFDQLNKASLLSLSKAENSLRYNTVTDTSLIQKETEYKTAITRLSLKLSQQTDSLQLQKIQSAIRDKEIDLGEITEEINNSPVLKSRLLTNRIPSSEEVKKMLDETTALLSYHLSEQEILIILVTGKDIFYHRSPVNAVFFNRIDSLRKLLNSSSGAYRNTVNTLSSDLYTLLIAPFQSKISSYKRLIIIPDDELHYLPFDMLMDADKKYLVEKFSIQYLYSTSLLQPKRSITRDNEVISFAPYANHSFIKANLNLFKLPATADEIKNIHGDSFIDSMATKKIFIENANRHGILHLATHALVNNEQPDQSYIAFYPEQGEPSNFLLYAQEIYNLRLDSTRLVILSACETGAGQLLKGEGLMSLSRAFSYAGCPNVITSLWKANDESTAIIISKLKYYLSRGFAPDMALQKAKTDLLQNTTIDPRLKQPAYWAHLVSIGNYEPIRHGLQWRWVAISTILMMLIYYFTKKRIKSKGREAALN